MNLLLKKSTEYLKCVRFQKCATSRLSHILHQPQESKAEERSTKSLETTEPSWFYSGTSSKTIKAGARASKNGSRQSNKDFQERNRQNTIVVSLTQGKYALIDAEDWDKIKNRTWCAVHIGKNWYAITNNLTLGGYRHLGMHRVIMNAPQGMDVDHINLNSLDNRKINLRVCTRGQNKCNARIPSWGTSQYRGVHRRKNRWVASIQYNGKKYFLGSFEQEVDAAKTYNQAATKHFGDCAYLNPVLEGGQRAGGRVDLNGFSPRLALIVQ